MKERFSRNRKWIVIGVTCFLVLFGVILSGKLVLSGRKEIHEDDAKLLDAAVFKKREEIKDMNPVYIGLSPSSKDLIDSLSKKIEEETLLAKEEETGQDEDTTEEPEEEVDKKIVPLLYSDIEYGKIGSLSSKDVPIAISTAENFVNIRELPNEESKVLGKLYNKEAAAVLSTEKDWVEVESGSVKGYITSQYLNLDLTKDELVDQYGTITATITVDGLNVRKEGKEDAERLTVIYVDEKYTVTKITDDWVKITIPKDNIEGYVSKEYVTLSVKFNQGISIEEEQEILRKQEEEKRAEEEAAKKKAEEEAAKKQAEAEQKAAAKKTSKKQGSTKKQDKKQKPSSNASNSAPAKSQTPSTENRAPVGFSEDDLKLLTALVHSESGNQPYEGKLAVANVVLNRMKSSKYPNTLSGVIYQSGQFSVARSGALQKQIDNYHNYSSKSQKSSIKAAKAALEGNNNIGNLLFFNGYSNSLYEKHPNGVRISGHLFW